jgi:hypothetical protein
MTFLVGDQENSGWFLNSFRMESWLNPLRGLPFGRLCWFYSWVARGIPKCLHSNETTT